jgi:methionyl-tRNA formyltransferase
MNLSPQPAVVFAYHSVGVRGLAALLANNFDVRLVVTHQDSPEENIWFESVSELAQLNDIPVITPDNPNAPEVITYIQSCQPEWLFSFYYRHMLGPELLNIAPKGAWNLHGSLLPKYRGRVPINWAVLHGETETGASLHRMITKPDAGHLVDQEAVPILPNDTAVVVFDKVVCAAEMILMRTLPKMQSGSYMEKALDLRQGSYFSGRRPEDGRINWQQSAVQIHNLIRAVAPPYPGAFFELQEKKLFVLGSYWRGESAKSQKIRLYWENDRCYADCADGFRFHITRLELDGEPLHAGSFIVCFSSSELVLEKV